MAFLTDEQRFGDNGNYLTKALFLEASEDASRYSPIFTLKEFPQHGLPSFYEEYLRYDSEYAAAKAIIGSWSHWVALKESKFFKPYYEKWEAERLERDKALAKTQLLKSAEEGNVTAQRILYGTPPEEPRKKRVTKKEKEQQDTKSLLDKQVDQLHQQAFGKAH